MIFIDTAEIIVYGGKAAMEPPLFVVRNSLKKAD